MIEHFTKAEFEAALPRHKITGQPINWIGDVVESVAQQTGKSVVPLVQSIDIPGTISAEEFESSIEVAVGEPSKGVIVFHFYDLLVNEKKYEVVKKKFTAGW